MRNVAFAAWSLLYFAVSPLSASGLPINVVCTLMGKAEPGQFEQVCAEFVQHLADVYPGHAFAQAGSTQTGTSVTVTVTLATRSGVSMKLEWTDANGQRISGQDMGLSVMDRDATPKMRQSLYQRVTAATPMQK